MDFKESPFMYGIAFVVIGFVIVQSVFFVVKAWKRAKELGIKQETLKQTVTSSALFTLAPALAILATVIVLARFAAQTVLDELGGSLDAPVTDVTDFAAIAWVMTLGIIFGICLVPFLCKKILALLRHDTPVKFQNGRNLGISAAVAHTNGIETFLQNPCSFLFAVGRKVSHIKRET